MKSDLPKNMSLTGCGFLGLSFVLYVSLELSSRWEQAKNPGEKSFGVAVLGMMFGIPMLISALLGFVCLLVGGAIFACKRFDQGK